MTDPWDHYLPDQWLPHCTLAGGLDAGQMGAAIEVLAGSGLPIAATVDSAAVVDSESGAIRRLLTDDHG
jgi:hypothetical protein